MYFPVLFHDFSRKPLCIFTDVKEKPSHRCIGIRTVPPCENAGNGKAGKGRQSPFFGDCLPVADMHRFL